MNGRVMRILWMALVAWALAACGDLERDNPFDPRVGGESVLRQQILGSWERDEGLENQVYSFKQDGSVEWHSYSSPDGGLVDRNASFPETLDIAFTGTWSLEGKTLNLRFTDVQTNDPGGAIPSLPADDLVLGADVRGEILTLVDEEEGSRRRFSRF